MTQAAATAPTTHDQIIDHTLRQIEAAWVTEQFDAIIEANWPTEPPAPPPAAGPTPPEPPRPGSPAPLQPRGRLTDPQDPPRVCPRQRAPPRGESSQVAPRTSHATPRPGPGGLERRSSEDLMAADPPH